MYYIGDKVVYPMHGAGVIIGIENRKILGKVKEYYILKIPVNDMQVMVPVDSVEESGVRDILDKEEMDRVLDILAGNEKVDMPTNWNRRYRFNMDRLKSGDIKEIAAVVRCLERLDNKKSLSTGERKMLNGAKQIIVSEMVLVYEKNLEEITEIVDKAIFGTS
ncbi:MAG: CarD family transcriptional regulator [Peptoniphilaceae bacterium]